ncbi:MAG: TIR domain-containing protein [Acidobacteria bacterium]|nr:TIR domain-containing protein [Acidobacteriota bacterium]
MQSLDWSEVARLVRESEREGISIDSLCQRYKISQEDFYRYRRAYSIAQLFEQFFTTDIGSPDIPKYLRWIEHDDRPAYERFGPGEIFERPRWKLYEASGKLLDDLYRNLTSFSLPPSMPSFFGDGGSRTVKNAATAVWLCANVGPFVNEVAKNVQVMDSHMNPLSVISAILEIIKVEARSLGNDEVLESIAYLLFSLGMGILPKETDWSEMLKEMVELQLESSSGSGYEKEIVRWALAIELEMSYLNLPERLASFDELRKRNQKSASNWDLNNWAYLFLRLELFRPATPMARTAIEEKPWAGAYDTYSWALFFEKDYAQAESFASRALEGLSGGGESWCEVQFHRAHIAYWSNRMSDALQIVEEMQKNAPHDFWTAKANQIKAMVPRPPANVSRENMSYAYDVAISFAGQDRIYADKLARALSEHGVRVFYDDFYRASLWGSDLYENLTEVYQKKSRFCVILISKNYARSRWTTLERRAAQARALYENEPYLLPIRIDETEIPGILPTMAYVSWEKEGIDLVVNLLLQKLGVTGE